MNKNLLLMLPIFMMSFAMHASQHETNIELTPQAQKAVEQVLIQKYSNKLFATPRNPCIETETIQLKVCVPTITSRPTRYKATLTRTFRQGCSLVYGVPLTDEQVDAIMLTNGE